MPRFSLLPLVAALALAAAVAPAALAEPNAFSAPQALPGSLPGSDQFQGGEPSVEFDPAADGHVYAVAPGGNGSGPGVGFWRSSDHGQTWHDGQAIGSDAGGGDSDVEVGLDHTVYVADLELAANAICRSHDFGVTFDSNCDTGTASNQTGPESDREWINRDPKDKNVLYFTYHDVSAQFPLIYRSTDGGSSFTPCGLVYQPGSAAFSNFGPGGTDVGKPAISRDGAIYVPITEPDGVGGSPTSPYNHFEVAVSKTGCDGTTQFENHEIYSAPGASLANIFSDLAVGADGTVYALAAGTLGANQPTNDVYLWVSHDQGTTWSRPIQVNTPDLKSNALPALATGNGAGQVAIGFYGSTASGDPSADTNQWRYFVATSLDDGRTFEQTMITPDAFHLGGICTTGILCVTGNRNLLDFSSIAVDPADGTVLPVFPGDPFDTPQNGKTDSAAAYVARQTAGTRLVPGAVASGHAPGSGTSGAPSGSGRPTTTVCAATSGFAGVGARPSGSRVRLTFSRRLQREADVDVFQASQGRRVVKERLVARFAGREFGLTWDGKANRPGRKVTDGYYFVRYRMPLGAEEGKDEKGGRADTRRITLRRSHGKWSLRPSFYRKAGCGTLSAYKLLRPAFGGPRNSALGISYRLSRAARVRVTVTRAGHVVQRFPARSAKANRTYRLTFSARHRARGDYRFRLVAVRAGRSTTATLTSKRL
jgi:hypothetical protein